MQSSPTSVEMIRKDSSMSHSHKSSGSASSGHSSFGHNSQVSSNGASKMIDPWGPKVGRAISIPKKSSGFSADVAPFRPRGGPMMFLNTDSEPDVIVSDNQKGKAPAANIGRPMRPIGSDSPTSSTKSGPDMHLGPPFSTDEDVHISGSRYVVICKIPISWTENGTLQLAFNQCGFTPELLAHKTVMGDDFLEVESYLFFDDLRAAEKCEDVFHMALTTAEVDFIAYDQFFAIAGTDPRADCASTYDGQIMFSVAFVGMNVHGFNVDAMFHTVHEFASSFGEVRSFELQEPCLLGSPFRFRAEYYKITQADQACMPGDFKDQIELGDDLLVDIQCYNPDDELLPAHPQVIATHANRRKVGPQGNWTATGELPYRRSAFADRGQPLTLQPHPRGRVAPEYRRTPDSRYDPRDIPRSGIHDNINYECLRNSGPSDVYGQPQTVVLENIFKGIDCRTTVMVRNIPNKLNAMGLKEWLDETSHGLYDFSYLRVDFSNNCNVGYAFVNFAKPEYIIPFVQKRVSKPWNLFGSEKTCEISYATIQGQDCLIAKFRNSSVMREWVGFRPKVFHCVDSPSDHEGYAPGDEVPFPGPNNMSKLQRSLDNAQAVGLYPPRTGRGRGRGDQSGRHSQYDRGTPRALLDERRHFTRSDGETVLIDGQHYYPALGPGMVTVYVAAGQSTSQNDQPSGRFLNNRQSTPQHDQQSFTNHPMQPRQHGNGVFRTGYYGNARRNRGDHCNDHYSL